MRSRPPSPNGAAAFAALVAQLPSGMRARDGPYVLTEVEVEV